MIKVSKDDNDEIKDFAGDTWLKIYEKLFGGFEDLGGEDSEESEDELESISSEYKTKNGYLKDGFVVDSDSDKSDHNGDQVNNDTSEDEESACDSSEDSSDADGSELEMEEYDYSDNE